MKNEFPLLDSLIMNGEIMSPPSQVKLIEAQEATDKYWLDENDQWDFHKDFGCMIPPYKMMRIESTAKLPGGKATKGKISTAHPPIPSRMGFKIEAYEAEDFKAMLRKKGRKLSLKPFKWCYIVEVFAQHVADLKGSAGVPGRGFLTVDDNGTFVQCWVESVTTTQEEMSGLRDLIWVCSQAAFYAISMMNCRNVCVSSEMTRVRGGKKTKRKPKPSTEYHVIKLPAPKTSGGGSGELTGTTKLHTARGHFKTYTAEAPLMGRHVGTYYWGWQVRGNRKNGEVISSYEVGAA